MSQQREATTFQEHLMNITTNAILAQCICLGLNEELGLFKGMAKYDEPKTSQQIADDLELKERFGAYHFIILAYTACTVKHKKNINSLQEQSSFHRKQLEPATIGLLVQARALHCY